MFAANNSAGRDLKVLTYDRPSSRRRSIASAEAQSLEIHESLVSGTCFSGLCNRTHVNDRALEQEQEPSSRWRTLLCSQEAQAVRVAHDNGFRCPVTNPDNNYG